MRIERRGWSGQSKLLLEIVVIAEPEPKTLPHVPLQGDACRSQVDRTRAARRRRYERLVRPGTRADSRCRPWSQWGAERALPSQQKPQTQNPTPVAYAS